MRIIGLIVITFFTAVPGLHTAQAQTGNFTSVPSSAFTGDVGVLNATGTARSIRSTAFAPVNLPHKTTVFSLTCGGRASFNKGIVFTLRRNEPQQANVDITTVQTSFAGTGFEFVTTHSINSGKIDNSKFNYYIVAELDRPSGNQPGNHTACTPNSIKECAIGFCRIRHSP